MTETKLDALTGARALELLREAVAERGGDYIYNNPHADPNTANCLYAHDDGPGCGVGLVLAKHGATLDELKAMDGQGVIADAAAYAPFGIDEEAVEILAGFQSCQDNRKPWSEALAHAEITAEVVLL